MSNETSYPDHSMRDESTENENVLDEISKSNGFLYVDINDYNENNFDGIEIKQEEEQVEDLTVEKYGIEIDKIYFDENLPLNSLKNSVNHSPNKSESKKICNVNKNSKKRKKGFLNKFIQKENISIKGLQTFDSSEKNPDSVRHKLRSRTWSKNINLNLTANKIERKINNLSSNKRTCVCVGCGVIFSRKSKYLNHEAEKTNFGCLNCGKYFCTEKLLEKHSELCRCRKNKNIKLGHKKHWNADDDLLFVKELENHDHIFFKCDKCNKSFVKKPRMISHILRNECSFEIYTCAICEENFRRKANLKKHIIAHLKSQYQGQYCFQSLEIKNNHSCTKDVKEKNNFTDYYSSCEENCSDAELAKSRHQNSIKSHSFKMSSLAVYKCHICKKIYKSILNYKKHLKSHGENTKKSDTDNKVVSNSSSNISAGHYQKSRKLPKYECDTCGKEFLKLIKLKIHIRNIHQRINYQCRKCNAKFPKQEDYNAHVNNQNCRPEDLCKCKTCGKVFAKKDYLKKHQYMHMNVLFKCKYCYCAFMKEKSYERHMEKMNCSKSARKIKIAEFNYKKCRLCENEYQTEELLLKHFKASHVGLEPHQCFCCDSCLPTFQDLQNHIQQHNTQKYTCSLCGKPYTSQEGFRKHRLKHKGAEFKCRFCESEFLNESRFKFHEKTCKKNPESGYEPPRQKEKLKKKDDKPKQSRQLHWESRIIMKRLRGDPKSLIEEQRKGDQQENAVTSAFFDDPETDTSDERGWFNNYYRTNEDDIAFGLKKVDESTPKNFYSDVDVSEFLQTNKKNKIESSDPYISSSNQDQGTFNDSSGCSEFSSTDSEDEVQDTDLPIDYNPKKCRLCVINFGQEYELLHHFIKTHPGEYAHKCPQCEVQSPLYAQLKEHLKTHGIGMGIFNCDNCSKQFKSEKKLNSHNIRCKGISNKINTCDETFPQPGGDCCKRCGKIFHTKFGYRRHKELCKKRKNKSKYSKKFSSYLNKNSKEGAFDNNTDGGHDFQMSDAEEANSVNQKIPVVCDEKLTSTKPEEKSESVEEKKKKEEIKSSYTGEPPLDSFPCRLCDKKFQYERGIVMHFKSAHPGNKPLVCHVCSMHLADKLKEHLKTHGIGEEFICELCGKRFNQKFLSKIHEMWHQGIEYKCNNCKQKFLNKEKMDKHIGENRCSNRQSLMRLPCDICGKSYRSKFGLSKHYITHTPKELRPVKNRMNCEYCGKWFEYNNGLQRHRRIHTGERPFCCRFCPKAFAQEGNCKAHERIHTGESKPRKKKPSVVPATSSVSSSIPPLTTQVSTSPSVSPHILPPRVETVSYPGHINLYIYNNIDSNGIVH